SHGQTLQAESTPQARLTVRPGPRRDPPPPKKRDVRARVRRASATAKKFQEFTMPRRQDTAVDQLRRLARPFRYRVSTDSGGFPLMPGRYGRIEWFDERDLAVYCDRPRFFAKIWAIPGVRRHQTGDQEMRAIFPPEALEHVAAVIRAKRWGGSGRGRRQNLVP